MQQYRLLFLLLILARCQGNQHPKHTNTLINPKKYYEFSNLNQIFRFSKAKIPVPFDVEKDSIIIGKQKIRTSRQCGKCHQTAYTNWNKSRHKVAFTNKLYKESHRKEPHIWCVNCHAPLHQIRTKITDISQRIQKSDGISCIVCHVRERKILTARTPPKTPGKSYVHSYAVVPQMKKAKFCGGCHQFNFPTSASAAQPEVIIAYTSQIMQNTLGEYYSSGFAGKATCQDCHLQGYSKRSHLFSGGHDIELLKESIFVSIKALHNYADVHFYRMTVYSSSIGHAFPTGDLFRKLKIRLFDKDTKTTITEFTLQKDYQNYSSQDQADQKPAKYLAKDSSIPEPIANEIASSKYFYFRSKKKYTKIFMEMHIDYLQQMSHVLSTMKLATTKPLIKSEMIVVE